MTDTVEIDGEEYDLTEDPSLSTVREVQQMSFDMVAGYLDESDIEDLDSLNEDQIMKQVLYKHGMDGMKDVVWSQQMMEGIQTISLATNTPFSSSDFDGMGATEYQEILNACTEALGGTASDFFGRLQLGTFSQQREVERLLQEQMESRE